MVFFLWNSKPGIVGHCGWHRRNHGFLLNYQVLMNIHFQCRSNLFFRREAEIIFRIAKEEKVTGKGHIWIVTQSILGDLDKESSAPDEFPIGLLGKLLLDHSEFLPPAYVRTTGGYVFTGVCLFNFRGWGGGGTQSKSRKGGTPSQVWGGGVPWPGLDVGGYPILGQWGGTPAKSRWCEVMFSQVCVCSTFGGGGGTQSKSR